MEPPSNGAMNFSSREIAVVLGLVIGLSIIYRRLLESRRIKALGHRAGEVRSWLPLGIDTVIRAAYLHLHHRDREFWDNVLAAGSKNGSYTAETSLVGSRVIFTADPENIKALLGTQFQDYGKGPNFYKAAWHMFGDSIATLDGEKWRSARHFVRPGFTKAMVNDVERLERYVPHLLAALAGSESQSFQLGAEGRACGKEVNVSNLITRYVTDVSSAWIFGRDLGCLKQDDPKVNAAFEEALRLVIIMARTGSASILVPKKKLRSSIELVEHLVAPFVDDILSLSPEEVTETTSKDARWSYLGAFASISRDRRYLRQQAFGALFGARDTTAATLVWIFYELARHPVVYAQLRRQVINALGPTEPPTYAQLVSINYLQWVIHEALRLYPLPYALRTALADTTLPRGGGRDGMQPVGVPAGTRIGYSVLHLQMRQDLLPKPSPQFAPVWAFSPERWESWQPKPWTFIPFSGGPRICLGQEFAMTQMRYTLARVAQRFERLELMGSTSEMQIKTLNTLKPVEDLKLAFWDSEEKGSTPKVRDVDGK